MTVNKEGGGMSCFPLDFPIWIGEGSDAHNLMDRCHFISRTSAFLDQEGARRGASGK